MLTPKQEKFIQNVVSGMSQREAYKKAYNAKYNNNAIDIKASQLFNSDKVKVRYQELMKRLEDKAIMTAEERMIWLTKVVKGEMKEEVPVMTNDEEEGFTIKLAPTKIDTKLKALDTLNKMSGEYTQKIELENEKPFEVNIKVV